MASLLRPFGLLVAAAAVAGPALAGDPLRVFVLAGQSNMQGHAHVRTLPAMALDPATEALHARLVGEDGVPRVFEAVRVSAIGSSDGEATGPLTVGFGPTERGPKLGPELAFGATMHEHLGEPILIIKTAWGGKSLHTDFRPPSAGPSPLPAGQLENAAKKGEDVEALRRARAEATGVHYREMIAHVRAVLEDPSRVHPAYREEDGFELAGFVWFQGWNDMVDGGQYPQRGKPGGYDAYSETLAALIRDVRKDLATPDLPFVIGVLGVGGPTAEYGPDQKRYVAIHQGFRDAMAAPAAMEEFRGSVAAVLTERCWDRELTRLRAAEQALGPRYKEIDERRKAGELTGPEAQAARKQLREATFTAAELDLLDNGVSNAEFHYLGSAKILCSIGEDFAEAMLGLMGEGKRR